MLISKLPSKTLIIPDIHFRIEIVNKILNKEKDADLVIFLGDYFDNFKEIEKETIDTITFLKENLTNPRFVFLLGNHDISYFYSPNRFCQCSGYTEFKNSLIRDILKPQDPKVLSSFHFFAYFKDVLKNKWLLSHAGYSPFWGNISSNKLVNFLQEEEKEAKKELSKNNNHWFIEAGYSRGGGAVVGGLTWLDWDWEFKEIPRLNQIVGHTPHNTPQYKIIKGTPHKTKQNVFLGSSYNLNLDTHSRHYAVFYDGKDLEIKETPTV